MEWPDDVAAVDIGRLRELSQAGVPDGQPRGPVWLRLAVQPSAASWSHPIDRPRPPLPSGAECGEMLRAHQPSDSPAENDIAKDIQRTFPAEPALSPAELGAVLGAYATRRPEVGYCQGMNFVAAQLLLTCDDPAGGQSKDELRCFGPPAAALAVFWFMVDWLLPSYWAAGLSGVLLDVAVIKALAERRLPALHAALAELDYDLLLLLPRWLCTVLVLVLPTRCVLRLWDSLLVQGRPLLIGLVLALLARAEAKVLSILNQYKPGPIDHQEALMQLDAVFKWTTDSADQPDLLLAEAASHVVPAEEISALWLDAERTHLAEQQALQAKRLDIRLASRSEFSVSEVEHLRRLYRSAAEQAGTTQLDAHGLQMMLSDTSPRHKGMAALLHSAFDTDADGWLDMEELVLGLSTLCKGTVHQRLCLGFRCYDMNNDGQLDVQEARAASRRLADRGTGEYDGPVAAPAALPAAAQP